MLVCVIYLCNCMCTVVFLPYGEGLMHSCTCPLNGILSIENNRWGEVALGQGSAETDNVFLYMLCWFMAKKYSFHFSHMISISLKIYIITFFSSPRQGPHIHICNAAYLLTLSIQIMIIFN